ncbi:MAG: metallophosphoesterase [Chthoniobacterales bacterium]
MILDGRLALFHQSQRWLAVADLHFGYEISQRAAGRLHPLWGMASIEKRLFELVADYRPTWLILLGDLVHNRAAAEPAEHLVARLRERCETVLLAGNHDRKIAAALGMVDSWETDGFQFHHGHNSPPAPDRIQVVGHHHPASYLTDGAGLRLKLPAFIREERRWILPAFSPWAAGAIWPGNGRAEVWLCTPRRVLRLQHAAAA